MKRGIWCFRLQNSTKSDDVNTSMLVAIHYFNAWVKMEVTQDSVNDIVTSLWAGWSGFSFLTFARDFCLVQNVQTSSGTHLGSYSVCTRVSSLGIKQPGSEADHVFPSCARVKNKWSHTFTPPVCFHDIYGDTFTLTFMEPEIWRVSYFVPYLAVYFFHSTFIHCMFSGFGIWMTVGCGISHKNTKYTIQKYKYVLCSICYTIFSVCSW